MNDPLPLSDRDWLELWMHPQVQAGFGIDMETTLKQFKSKVYAVKFKYSSASVPMYRGDLVLLMPNVFYKPMTLIRVDGKLRNINLGEV